jgi:hypothetical protein
MIRYRAATTEDAAELSAVALAAKKHWGYPPAWIELWRSDLAVLPEQIEQDFLLVAETPARIAGFVGVSVEGRARRSCISGCCPSSWAVASGANS